MAEAVKTDNTSQQRPLDGGGGGGSGAGSGGGGGGIPKRKHRRGKKSKMLPKKTKNQYPQWKLDMPTKGAGGGHVEGNPRLSSSRTKLVRSRSLLVPYNTNRFLMEEHMSELPKDDSDDNCFSSQAEDQVLFLSKEFSNVYERARLERLETMSKQDLIQECLAIEDRYSKAQNVSKEFSAKIRALEDKIRQLTRENQLIRSHYLRSCPTSAGPAAAAAAAASPPSAVAPTASSARELQARQQPPQQPQELLQPTPMDSSSEDSESDSSSTTSSTSSNSSSSSSDGHEMGVAGLNIANGHAERHDKSRSRSRSRSPIHLNGHANEEERQGLLDDNQMDEDDNSSDGIKQGDADVK